MRLDGVEASDPREWMPQDLDANLPPYLALIQALEDDIRSGVLAPGFQLPTHRKLATQLGVSISTVSKAYREAGMRGVIVGRTGHGTFVSAPEGRSAARADRPINIGINLAPQVGQRDALREVLGELSKGTALDGLFAYNTHQGFPEQRVALSEWLRCQRFQPLPEQLVATNGAQHGLDLALHLLCAPGETILVEELTYVGFKALASLNKFNLAPVAMDAEGLVPEALERAILATGARLLYAMPTLHSPTGRTMSQARRRQIARIVETRDLHLIEDDVYAFMLEQKPEPIAALVPDRTLYLSSFSKILELGYRAGILVVPPKFIDRVNHAVRATAWTATPFLFDVALRLIRSGMMEQLVGEIRRESCIRRTIFRRIFRGATAKERPDELGYHVWLELPDGWSAANLFYAARNEGVQITPPGSASVGSTEEGGVRLCLGSTTRSELETALATLRKILEEPTTHMLSVT